MEILIPLIIGGIAGYLAGLIKKGEGFGIVGNVAVGIIGGYLARWIFGLAGWNTASWLGGGFIGDIAVATVGAIILLFILGIFFK